MNRYTVGCGIHMTAHNYDDAEHLFSVLKDHIQHIMPGTTVTMREIKLVHAPMPTEDPLFQVVGEAVYDADTDTLEESDEPICYMGHVGCYDEHIGERLADEADWREERERDLNPDQ